MGRARQSATPTARFPCARHHSAFDDDVWLRPTRRSVRPTPKSAAVAAQMSRMPRSSTKPEVALRRSLFARGLRFTLQRRDLPGTPDIVLSRARISVFVDG